MPLTYAITIMVLAGFVGVHVISKVPTTLHTPLMSGTNAIHGIVLLAGLLQMSQASGVLEDLLIVAGLAFSTANIVGGFLVTHRTLAMFRTSSPHRSREKTEEGVVK